jgi:site-specific recombinase XerD
MRYSSMSGIRLKFVHQWVDNRQGASKARFYFRRHGKRVPLPGSPGSTEFMAAYQAALAAQPVPMAVGAGRHRPASLAALVATYFGSPSFLALKPATRQTYRNILERMRAEHGDKPAALLTKQHVNAMLAKRIDTPAAANHWLRLTKTLMAFAVEEGWRKDNPAIGVKPLKNRTEGFHTWTEEEIAQFEVHHPVGTRARLAFALLLYTAQRRSDVVCMGRQHIHGDLVQVRQQKTGAMLVIPLHPKLAAVIAASAGDHLTLLTTRTGAPFTAAGFGNWFRDCCNDAGLPKHCAAHELRKAACRRLAEAGCSANVIASISAATPPSSRWPATPRQPTSSVWRARLWRPYGEQKLATVRDALPIRGKKPEISKAKNAGGGRGRTRTYEGVSQRIYSPPPLPLGTLSRKASAPC